MAQDLRSSEYLVYKKPGADGAVAVLHNYGDAGIKAWQYYYMKQSGVKAVKTADENEILGAILSCYQVRYSSVRKHLSGGPTPANIVRWNRARNLVFCGVDLCKVFANDNLQMPKEALSREELCEIGRRGFERIQAWVDAGGKEMPDALTAYNMIKKGEF